MILKSEEISLLARPCYADPMIAKRCINEAEQLDIKPAIGDALFLELESQNAEMHLLLDGGVYADKEGNKRTFCGLKTAIAYYAYARIVRAGSSVQTRYGYVQKDEDNSSRTDIKERTSAYLDAFKVADGFMADVLRFLNASKDKYPTYTGGRLRNNRINFKIIGK